MATYLDTGAGAADQYLGNWLDQNVRAGLRGFRGQFGYFRFGALAPYAGILQAAAAAGHPVHLVLGSNHGTLVAADLQRALRVAAGPDASVTVVAFAGAEFHPKTIHLIRADQTVAALVGSSNCTENGLGTNVEASIVLDEQDGDATDVILSVGEAVDRWRAAAMPGVFLIENDADVQSLVDAGVINVPQPPRPPSPAARGRRATALGRRIASWGAQPRGRQPAVPALIPAPVVVPPVAGVPRALPAAVVVAASGIITHQWCKELATTDAQHVNPGSNPTGKLRFSQSGFPINHTTWFRNSIFGGLLWQDFVRNGNNYERATIPFQVKVRGEPLGVLNLTVDHAPHREAGQGNVPTVLAWGHRMMQLLTATNHVGDWVAITRDTAGTYTLTIQQNKPIWAP